MVERAEPHALEAVFGDPVAEPVGDVRISRVDQAVGDEAAGIAVEASRGYRSCPSRNSAG